MTETPKCPHGCGAPQEAGGTFYELQRIPTHKNKRGAIVLGRYENVLMRRWKCSKCYKAYAVDEPRKKPAQKKTTKGKKRGKKPKRRKRSTANAAHA